MRGACPLFFAAGRREKALTLSFCMIIFLKVTFTLLSPVSQPSSREKQEERASSSSLSSVKLSSPLSASGSSGSSARPDEVGESRSLVGPGSVRGPAGNVNK